MTGTSIVQAVRDNRFQAIVALAAIVAGLLAARASELLAFGIVVVGVVAVVLLSVLDHRRRAAQPVRQVALVFPDGVDPQEITIDRFECTVRHAFGDRSSRTAFTYGRERGGGWVCPLPDVDADEVLDIEFTDAAGGRWRLDRFAPSEVMPRRRVKAHASGGVVGARGGQR